MGESEAMRLSAAIYARLLFKKKIGFMREILFRVRIWIREKSRIGLKDG
jgi:hypothetical protein